MTPLIIVLIVIGMVFIIISCFFMNSSKEVTIDNNIIEDTLLQTSLVKKKVEDTLNEVTDETIIKTEDELSKISNEKIIAVNDFSNMVLDKINNNHDEVVFLYNMLNEKENEIKNLMKQVSTLQEDVIHNMKPEEDIQQKNIHQEDIHQEDIKPIIKSKDEVDNSIDTKVQKKTIAKEIDNNKTLYTKTVDTSKNSQNLNRNDMILQMYDEGKNVVQIAKELGLGQGEVKLIIDLYKY